MILPLNNINGVYSYRREQSLKSSAPSFNAAAYYKINKNSPEYIEYIYKYVKKMCKQPVEINIESGKIQNIINDSDSYIFILNHTFNQFKDLNCAKFFNTLLYREYLYNGLAKTCPRSKILANSNILNKQKDHGELYRWLGVTPVNVGFGDKNKQANSLVLRNLTNEFINNDINLFMFPEGSLASLVFLPLKYKFQPGVSSIIKHSLEKKENVKVIPIGFAHKNGNSAIHIGETVCFSKQDNSYLVNQGNLNSKYFDKNLAKLYKNDELILTENGIPVSIDNIVPYISGILVRNLECVIKEAKDDLKMSSGKVFQL